MTNNIEPLIDRWVNDPSFRASVRRDAAGAVRAAGVTLTPDEEKVLQSMDWGQTDDQLMARVSKMKKG